MISNIKYINDNGSGSHVITPAASDIKAYITAALVLVRVATSSLSGTIAWRCVFLLLEKCDIDLQQLNSIVSWKLFRPLPGYRQKSNSEPRKMYGIYVAAILLFMWPATFSAPLLTSAVDWLPYILLVDDVPESESVHHDVSMLTRTLLTDIEKYWAEVPRMLWDNYLQYQANRQAHLIKIMEYVNILAFSTQVAMRMIHCRYINKWAGHPTESQVNGASYACIALGEIKWSTKDSDIKPMADRLRTGKDISAVFPHTSRQAEGAELTSGYIQALDIDNAGYY